MSIDTPTTDIAKVRAGILSALADANPATQLVAASKRQPDAAIDAILAAGQRIFGENRVQEAEERWVNRRADYTDLQLRLIGPLQSNKALAATKLFDTIETLDRPKLGKALADAIQAVGRTPTILIQVNTGDEPQKAGVSVRDLDGFLRSAVRDYDLTIRGLMCIPPVDQPAGPHFALLRKLAERHGLPQLSMGMSADYVLAAQYGATHVRVGTALFGSRNA